MEGIEIIPLCSNWCANYLGVQKVYQRRMDKTIHPRTLWHRRWIYLASLADPGKRYLQLSGRQQPTRSSRKYLCGRPSLNNFQASSWSKMCNYYDPTTTAEAARLMVSVAHKYRGNNNFEYDLVDITRQAIADRARIVYNYAVADFKSFDKKLCHTYPTVLGTTDNARQTVGHTQRIQSRELDSTSAQSRKYIWRERPLRMECPRTNHHMGKPLLRRHRQVTRLCP